MPNPVTNVAWRAQIRPTRMSDCCLDVVAGPMRADEREAYRDLDSLKHEIPHAKEARVVKVTTSYQPS